MRFYEPDSGDIFIGGKNIKEINIKLMRRKIGVVFQQPFLFAETLYKNMVLGNDDLNVVMIKKYLEICNCNEFVYKNEQGLDQYTGFEGCLYSGGQK